MYSPVWGLIIEHIEMPTVFLLAKEKEENVNANIKDNLERCSEENNTNVENSKRKNTTAATTTTITTKQIE